MRRLAIRIASVVAGIGVGVVAFRSCGVGSIASMFARGSTSAERIRLAWEEVHAAPR